MKQTLIDYLGSLQGYQFEMKNPVLMELDKVFRYLIRPDNSIAAKLDDIKWVITPTQQEMRDYGIYSGRGLPSLLCDEGDLTNPGSH